MIVMRILTVKHSSVISSKSPSEGGDNLHYNKVYNNAKVIDVTFITA